MKIAFCVLVVLWSSVAASFGQTGLKAINNPDPVYPPEAATLGYGGSVLVFVEINKKGNVSVKNAFGPAAPCSNLDDSRAEKIRKAVVETAKQVQFEPPLKDGKPTTVELSVTYRFDSSGFPVRDPKELRGKVIEGGVLQGRFKYLAKPEYPSTARAARVGGAVPIGVLVDIDGKVIAAAAFGGHPQLRAAAEKAACSSSIEPVSLSGTPVQVNGVITFTFVP